jgi:dTDP-glucose 4,6-dehydratase
MRLRDGRVVPAFIGQALAGRPLTVFGDGSQTRSFCYVSDLIDGIFKLAMSDFHDFHNPREMTISEFADEIIRITGTKSTTEYKPLPVGRSESASAGYLAREKNSWLGTASQF